MTRSDGVVSFFWVANFVGAFTAGVLNVYVTDRLGFGIVSRGALVIENGFLLAWLT